MQYCSNTTTEYFGSLPVVITCNHLSSVSLLLFLIYGVHRAHCVALCSGSLRVKLLKLLFCLIKMMIQTFVHFKNYNCHTQTDTSGQTEVRRYHTTGSRFKNMFFISCRIHRRHLKKRVTCWTLSSGQLTRVWWQNHKGTYLVTVRWIRWASCKEEENVLRNYLQSLKTLSRSGDCRCGSFTQHTAGSRKSTLNNIRGADVTNMSSAH